MGIYGHRFDSLIEAQVIQEKFKFFEFLKKKNPTKFKQVKKSDQDKIIEKFKEDYNLTTEVLDSGFDIFSVIKTKEDFEKMIKATGTSHVKSDNELIFYTYCYTYDYPDTSIDFKGLIETIKKEDKQNKDYKDNAIKILELASHNKLICISVDTVSLFYCTSDKKTYSVDYKGRVNGGYTIDELLEDYT